MAFNKIDLDVYFMEYDDERSGGLEPLKYLPKGNKRVMPGFITTKQGKLETLDFLQKKFEEAAIALAEFNSVFPNDPRFQETTLLIAESAVNFAPKDQLCDILKQSLEFMVNPSEKFVKRINKLKNKVRLKTDVK